MDPPSTNEALTTWITIGPDFTTWCWHSDHLMGFFPWFSHGFSPCYHLALSSALSLPPLLSISRSLSDSATAGVPRFLRSHNRHGPWDPVRYLAHFGKWCIYIYIHRYRYYIYICIILLLYIYYINISFASQIDAPRVHAWKIYQHSTPRLPSFAGIHTWSISDYKYHDFGARIWTSKERKMRNEVSSSCFFEIFSSIWSI